MEKHAFVRYNDVYRALDGLPRIEAGSETSGTIKELRRLLAELIGTFALTFVAAGGK